MNRTVVVLLAAGCVASLVPAQSVAAKTTTTRTSYTSPTQFSEFSQCDDGDGSAVCAASAAMAATGTITTAASLRPVKTVATGGRAEGRGGPVVHHRLARDYSAVRYRFYFEAVNATARKDPALARDLAARAFAVGHVSHASCDACETHAFALVADADPLSPPPAEVSDAEWRIDVEMRNPEGKVPKGKTHATGYVLSDVGLYEGRSAFASAAQVEATGRLARVEVEAVP